MFRNEYIVTEKIIKEYVYNFFCKNIIIIGLIIAILGFVMFVITKNIIMLTIAFISIISIIVSPIILTKQLLENSKRLNNGKIERTYIDFLDNIVMNEGKVHLEFEYSQIKSILQTKNLIILKTSNQTAILVLKEGFSKGNKENFVSFINDNINL